MHTTTSGFARASATSAVCATPLPWRATWSSSRATRQERAQRRRLGAAERPRPLVGDLDPVRALGRPDRRPPPPARSTGPTSRSSRSRRHTPWDWPTPPRTTRPSSPSRSTALRETDERRGEGRPRRAGRASAPGSRASRPGVRSVRESDLDAARGPGPGPSGGPQFRLRRSTARQAVAQEPQPGPALAAQVEILHACGKDKEAREAYQVARAARPLGRPRSAGFPPARERSSPAGRPRRPGRTASAEPANAAGTDETRHQPDRPDDARPLGLGPFPAERSPEPTPPACRWNLAEQKGKNVSSSSSWAGSVPTACSSSSSSARNTRPSRN